MNTRRKNNVKRSLKSMDLFLLKLQIYFNVHNDMLLDRKKILGELSNQRNIVRSLRRAVWRKE